MFDDQNNTITCISLVILCTIFSELAAINPYGGDTVLHETILQQQRAKENRAVQLVNETEKPTEDSLINNCDCGSGGHECEFDILGARICKCKAGYGIKWDGRCTDCDCGSGGHECEFDILGARICKCKAGYGIKLDGRCTACKCSSGFGNISCTFDFETGEENCFCPSGFRHEQNLCVDINECLESNTCLYTDTMACVNLPGSFQCVCKEGYHLKTNDPSPNAPGCYADQPKWKIPVTVTATMVFFVIAAVCAVIGYKKYRCQFTSNEPV